MDVADFIAKYWGKPGGAERATYQMFLTELAQLLGAPTPDPGAGGELGNYQFEGPVRSEAVFLSKHNKRIDLYKRDCFILEAKQSQLKEGETLPDVPPEETLEPVHDLFGNIVGHAAASGRRAPRYDRLMADARIQAERYSLALPTGHKPPPFLIVADIGRSFELYFDWTGDGRGYGFFPDQQNYRFVLTALAGDEPVGATGLCARDLLRAIWLDPAGVDPRRKAVAVTRDIAERLSRVAEQLEKDEREGGRLKDRAEFEIALGIEHTSLFLMRVLFCMFAEDVELLPKGSFTMFLDESRSKSAQFWTSGLHDLWAKMNSADALNRYWSYGDEVVRHFNGNLFGSAAVYDLPQEFKGELYEAARRDWRSVEPAIFGTLLEQVLTPGERAKLGAHYTPRPYVQRLVNATIGDVLVPEWEAVRDRVRNMLSQSSASGEALALIRAFHAKLCATRILDPACGTGNFLYVAMELLLLLENNAIQLAAELGEELPPAVHPNQFLGLELNSRAAVISELVLWIGWLRHRLANHPDAIGDPVLPPLRNINMGTHGGYDAVLRRTETGEVDGEHPLLPTWPEAEFIVGNPPFIGKGEKMRDALGDDYIEALRKANPRVGGGADFVMQWWDRAAHVLTTPGTRLRRFGFVTTNSITQTFSRRVIEGYLNKSPSPSGEGLKSLSLVLAIPDHPWIKPPKDQPRTRSKEGSGGPAAVRIAMTVAQAGDHEGRLLRIVGESALDTDNPVLAESEAQGRINPDLTIGADVTKASALRSNEGISNTGMLLAGQGFKLPEAEAKLLLFRDGPDSATVVKPYVGGGELMERPRHRYVIDFQGLSEAQSRQRFPACYQHILATVKPERDSNRQKSRRENWWLFGRSNAQLRSAKAGLNRFIATVETAKHRVFQFVDGSTIPDHMAISISTEEAFHLAVLSSRIHCDWSLELGGTLEDRPRYNKASCFDPFPFPDATPAQRSAIAALAEELDAARKQALAETPGLTMTEIYNWREKLRGGVALSPHDEDRARAARAGIVDRLHQQIDAAVAEAYGWPTELAPAEIVARLVALNAERAAEEQAGHIRWLRPDYQIPRFAKKAKKK